MKTLSNQRFTPSFRVNSHYNADRSPLAGAERLSKFLSYSIKVSHYVSNKTRGIDSKLVKEIAIVVMNLCACVKKNKRLDYSRNTKHNKKSRYNKKGIRTPNIIKAIDVLERHGYIINTIASSKQDPRKPRMSSFIQPTQKFIDQFCSNDEALMLAEAAHVAANEVIILRDINGKDVDYTDCTVSIEARKLVEELNLQSSKHSFIDIDGVVMDNIYARIFGRGDFTFSSGGRFYRADVQNIRNKEDQRLHMRINGDGVVEVDYSNLHLRLLTDLHGVDASLLKDEDLYMLPLSDDELTTDNRWLIKQSVNIMFNNSSDRAAMQTINNKMRENSDKEFSFSGGKEVLRAIKAAYPWLANDFCQGEPRGHYLMNLDSQIASHVIKDFVTDNQAICVVHDSFVVQQHNMDKLISSMTNAYGKVVSSRVPIKVHMKVKWLEQSPLTAARIGEESIVVSYK